MNSSRFNSHDSFIKILCLTFSEYCLILSGKNFSPLNIMLPKTAFTEHKLNGRLILYFLKVSQLFDSF